MEEYTLNDLQISYQNLLNSGQNVQPTSVDGTNNVAFRYYQRLLLEKVLGIVQIDNIPTTWDRNYLLWVLFTEGLLIACMTEQGNYALRGNAHDMNMYYSPLRATVSTNSVINFDGLIGVDCELVYIRPYVNGVYFGIMDIVDRYAQKLASTECSLDMTIINSRVSHIFRGSTTAELKSYQQMYDDITKGKPASFLLEDNELDSTSSSKLDVLNVKNTFVGREIMEIRRSIINEFLTNVGIDNANTDKRERLNSEEVNVNNTETNATINYWITNLNECFDRVNDMFGFSLRASIKDFREEVVIDEF